jgi:hypothetical protein
MDISNSDLIKECHKTNEQNLSIKEGIEGFLPHYVEKSHKKSILSAGEENSSS